MRFAAVGCRGGCGTVPRLPDDGNSGLSRELDMKLLLIDDDTPLRMSLRLALEALGHHVTDAADADQARGLLDHRPFDAAFLGIRPGRAQGLDLLTSLLRLAPRLPLIVVNAFATLETAEEAMRGALDIAGDDRGLCNTVERGSERGAGERVDVKELPTLLGSATPPAVELGGRVTLDELEREHLRRLLLSTSRLDEAAKVLGIDPSTLYRKRKRFGL
jgi:DNA-binding NtrC family response regulator